MNEILRLENVSLNYHTENGEITALKNINFSAEKGEFIAIIGPSGCGKTSILSMISGLLKPSEGKILLDGKEVSSPNDRIGYMLQKDELFPWRTIEKNIFLPLEIKRIKTKEKKDEVYMIRYFDIEDEIRRIPDSEQLMKKYDLLDYECNMTEGEIRKIKDGHSLMGRGYFILKEKTEGSVCSKADRLLEEYV